MEIELLSRSVSIDSKQLRFRNPVTSKSARLTYLSFFLLLFQLKTHRTYQFYSKTDEKV